MREKRKLLLPKKNKDITKGSKPCGCSFFLLTWVEAARILLHKKPILADNIIAYPKIHLHQKEHYIYESNRNRAAH